jgi:dienelactone hydrolase
MEVVSKRVFPYRDGRFLPDPAVDGYEEWRIDYAAEGPESMPEASLRRVPAYLLVPHATKFRPPYPAAVCFHQCSCDCGSGKEAVVGKHVDRPDQAYGYELVLQGFVVLAPDHYNCGERNVPSIRGQDQQVVGCFPAVSKVTGRTNMRFSEALHAARAVDLLESLEFVDKSRIAAVGHSMGTGPVIEGMACDARIRAGIVSGGGPDLAQLACIAPRPLMQLQGLHDGGPEKAKHWQEIHAVGKAWYEVTGRREDLVLEILPGGHVFLDQFKWKAYHALKSMFGMMPPRERVSLTELLSSRLPTDRTRLDADGEYFVLADAEALGRAFGGIFGALCERMVASSEMGIAVCGADDQARITITVSEADDDLPVPHGYGVRGAEQTFVEHGTALTHGNRDGGIEYAVTLRTIE